MKFEHTRTMNWEGALRGMRNPMNSHDRSDSVIDIIDLTDETVVYKPETRRALVAPNEEHPTIDARITFQRKKYAEIVYIGPSDMSLAQKLILAGSEHRKFMRQIFICVDITAPLYWWKEFDTYKVATVRNSCSTMHKIHTKEFDVDDFEHDAIDDIVIQISDSNFLTAKNMLIGTVQYLEHLRCLFNSTREKKYWRALIQSLPDSYLMKATLTFTYETLFAMCSKGQRRFHKLNEWSGIDNPELPHFTEWSRTLPYALELIFIDEVVGT